MPSISFQVTGNKRSLQVRRAGAEGTGDETKAIFAIRGGRWRGLLLNVRKHTAEWRPFRSRIEAQHWLDATGLDRRELEV
jgi:hypothetical protein